MGPEPTATRPCRPCTGCDPARSPGVAGAGIGPVGLVLDAEPGEPVAGAGHVHHRVVLALEQEQRELQAGSGALSAAVQPCVSQKNRVVAFSRRSRSARMASR